MCDIELNFFETKNKYVITSLVELDELNVGYKYKWFKGRKEKSYGAFVKRIGDAKHGFKAFILPKIKKLNFRQLVDEDTNNDSVNTENKDRIEGKW